MCRLIKRVYNGGMNGFLMMILDRESSGLAFERQFNRNGVYSPIYRANCKNKIPGFFLSYLCDSTVSNSRMLRKNHLNTARFVELV